MHITKNSWLFIFLIMFSISGCSVTQEADTLLNLFPVEQDVALGQQVSQQIANDPAQFPLLPEQGNEEVYQYIRNITNKILSTGKVANSELFAWEVKIIDDDETLNAFATPGGYIYVYTGLIRFLDSEDQLAGVMGHEIAHAALRHSTRQMTKNQGLAALTAIATKKANPGMVEQVALGLVNLTFSRDHETESDIHSVIYLCETDYNAAGAAGFFRKIEGQPTQPAFLSTHPNPGNRVENIENEAQKRGCTGGKTYAEEYARIKKLLE